MNPRATKDLVDLHWMTCKNSYFSHLKLFLWKVYKRHRFFKTVEKFGFLITGECQYLSQHLLLRVTSAWTTGIFSRSASNFFVTEVLHKLVGIGQQDTRPKLDLSFWQICIILAFLGNRYEECLKTACIITFWVWIGHLILHVRTRSCLNSFICHEKQKSGNLWKWNRI